MFQHRSEWLPSSPGSWLSALACLASWQSGISQVAAVSRLYLAFPLTEAALSSATAFRPRSFFSSDSSWSAYLRPLQDGSFGVAIGLEACSPSFY